MENLEKTQKEFLVVQIIMSKQEINVGTTHQYWDNIIRKVKANNIEEAVGKFMINTQNVYAIQRLNPVAYELSQVLSL